MSRASSRASSAASGMGEQHSAPPPRLTLQDLSDQEDEAFHDSGAAGTAAAADSSNNTPESSQSRSQSQPPAAQQQEDSSGGDDAGASAASAQSATTTNIISSELIIYDDDKMNELRDVARRYPILSTKFQSFMRGIHVAIEASPLATPGTGTGTPQMGGGTGAFSGRASGSGTPYSPAAPGGGFPVIGGRGPIGQDTKAGAGGGGAAGGNQYADPNAGAGGGGFKGFTREVFRDVQVSQTAIKERTLLHRVRGIFAKVSEDNFASVKVELCALPIRQSDDEQVREIIHWIYDKAVQPEDEIYVPLYANLIEALTKDIATKDSKKANAVRKALIEKCQQSFDRRVEVVDAHKNRTGGVSDAAETHVDGRDSAASAALKSAIAADDDPEYVRNREKTRLRANIKFLAQLFRVSMVNPRVVNYVLYSLLYGTESEKRHKPEEYEIEMFCDLIKKVQALLPKDVKEQYLSKYLDTVREHSNNPKTSIRVRCLLQDLLELSENGWMTREERRKRGLLVAGGAPAVPVGGTSVAVPGVPGAPPVTVPMPMTQQRAVGNNNNNGPAFPAAGGRGGGVNAPPSYGSPTSPLPPAYGNNSRQQQQGMGRQASSALSGTGGGGVAAAVAIPKDAILQVIENYKSAESPQQQKQLINDFLRPLTMDQRHEQLLQWMTRIVKFVRKGDERSLVGPIVAQLSETRVLTPTAGMVLMNRLAPNVALEYEDNPKLFASWAEIVQPNSAGAVMIQPCVHTAMLRELIKQEVPFEIIDKMLTETLRNSPTASWQFKVASEAPMGRCRLLPAILSCTRDSGDDDAMGDDNDFMPASATGGSNNDDSAALGGSSVIDRGNSMMSAGAASSNAAAAAGGDEFKVKRDLLGYLLVGEGSGISRQDTPHSFEFELDLFDTLTNPDAPLQVNLHHAFKKVKGHPQRADAIFVAGAVCAIFCFLRIAAVTGERMPEFERVRDILKELRVPGENTQLFVRESYLTYCEMGAQPRGAFGMMMQWFIPQSQYGAEMKSFADWKKQFGYWIAAVTGWTRDPKTLPQN